MGELVVGIVVDVLVHVLVQHRKRLGIGRIRGAGSGYSIAESGQSKDWNRIAAVLNCCQYQRLSSAATSSSGR